MRGLWHYLVPVVVIGGLVPLAGCGTPVQDQQLTIVRLVRHAEKESIPPQNLTVGGLDRAQALADLADNWPVTAIYATNTCRTAQTAQPSAARLGLPVRIQHYDSPGDGLVDCQPEIDVPTQALPTQIHTATELAQQVLSEHTGEDVLIVGHSDTVPEIVVGLGGESLCPEYFPLEYGKCHIPQDQFDNLFIVIVLEYTGTALVGREHYGG